MWDLRRRLVLLVAVVFIAAAVALLAAHSPWAIAPGALALAAFVVSLVFGARVSRETVLERERGYSTIYDFAGFELRDPRTLEVLRTKNVAPADPGSRSLALGILGVKPGTVLAKRLDEG